jgi:hypothetical protein
VGVYLDGKKLGEYAQVYDWSIRFAPDSSHLAWRFRRAGQWFVAFGDRSFGPFEPDTIQEMRIGRGGRTICFSARQDGKWYFFTVGERHGPYDGWSMAAFSPDGERLAHCGKAGGKTTVCLNGKSLGTFDEAWALTFSPDSEHFACGVRNGGQYFLCVDGEMVPAGLGGIRLAYSPDSRRLAAIISGKTGSLVIEGTEKGKVYYGIQGLCFSRDSKHLAYWACRDDHWYIVIDDREVIGFKGKPLEDLVFDELGKLCGAGVEFPENIRVREMWSEDLRLVLWELHPAASNKLMRIPRPPGTGGNATPPGGNGRTGATSVSAPHVAGVEVGMSGGKE